MATASVNFTILDEKGAKSQVTVYVPDSTDTADLIEFAEEMAALLDAMIGGQIVNIGACLSVAVPAGVKSDPVEGSDVEEGARFIFESAGGYSTAVRVPTFLEEKIATASKLVNQADGAVAAFIAAMTDGLTMTSTNDVEPTDYRAADVTGIRSAVESFQRSRK